MRFLRQSLKRGTFGLYPSGLGVERVHHDAIRIRWISLVSDKGRAAPMRRAILVTGGTGLLGKHLVSQLVRLGYHVRILSRHSPSSELAGSAKVITGDIRDGKLIEEALAGCDAVFHCAAEVRDVNT